MEPLGLMGLAAPVKIRPCGEVLGPARHGVASQSYGLSRCSSPSEVADTQPKAVHAVTSGSLQQQQQQQQADEFFREVFVVRK